MEIMRRTPWSRIREQNSVDKEFMGPSFSSLAWEGTSRHQHQSHLPPLGRIFWLVIVHVCTICKYHTKNAARIQWKHMWKMATGKEWHELIQYHNQRQSVIDQGNLITRKTWSVFKHVRLKKTRMSELSKLMIDQGNLINTTLQYKTTLKYIMRSRRSTPTMRQFVKELRKTWTSKFQDYHNLLWSNCRVPTFENWFRKSRTIRIDMLFNETYNRVNHLIPSVKNQNKRFMKLETSNCVNYSIRNPKRSAKCDKHTGTLASSTARAGHFLRKGREENKKFVQYTMDLLSIPNYYIKKGRPHGHRYGKKPGDKEYYIAHQLKKKCKKKYFQGIHDRCVRDDKFRRNMIEIGRTEDLCRQMDDLADEDHTHHLTPQEMDNDKRNWWIRSNKIGSDTMPIQHRSDFKQALSTLRQLKEKEEEAQRNQRWTQSSSSSWWSWQESWWTPYSYESHHGDVPSTDWSGQPFKAWFSRIHLLCYSWIVYSWRRSTVTDGGCKYHT